jgi:polyketide synthase PksJ
MHPTLNKMGFTHSTLDIASEAFLEHVKALQGNFIDIGCAFGFHTIEALKLGGKVFAIDIEPKHIDALNENCPTNFKPYLSTQVASFPDQVLLSKNFYDGALLSRIFIFLNPEQTMQALAKIYDCLKPGGKLFIISGSVYSGSWINVHEEYLRNKLAKSKWPGYITNLWEKEPESKENFPNEVHLFDLETMEEVLSYVGFSIISSQYSPPLVTNKPNQQANIVIIAQK